MKKRTLFLSAVAVMPLVFAAAKAAAALEADPPAVSRVPGAVRPRWLVRAEGSLVDMRDNWLGLPAPEVGLTVGRDLIPRVSVELTGSVREPDDEQHRSWSAAAAARWVAVASANGRHALTVAGGPFIEFDHVVHGTMPFAHAELAYVYRAPFGLTVLTGMGPNIALASSGYVEPPPAACPEGGSPSFCIDLGPDAREIHAGDRTFQMRLAVG